MDLYVQRDQPPGVPPLALDGERTLPDVPEENYWFQRHVAVYAWVAAHVAGKRVVDMASGEGYGADLLAGAGAASVGGVVFVSTPNVLTLAPPGHERSGNPWHVREYRPEEFAALCCSHFRSVELHGLFHARKLAVHALALERLAWDRV